MPITSPCVRNCCLDGDDVCLGCGRTVQEVIDWGDADDKQKLEILKAAKKRQSVRAATQKNLDTL